MTIDNHETVVNHKVVLVFRKLNQKQENSVARPYATTFYVLKEHPGFGLLLGRADSLEFGVVKSAALVLRVKDPSKGM